MTRLLVTLRLVAPDCAVPPPASQALIARACGLADWDRCWLRRWKHRAPVFKPHGCTYLGREPLAQ